MMATVCYRKCDSFFFGIQHLRVMRVPFHAIGYDVEHQHTQRSVSIFAHRCYSARLSGVVALPPDFSVLVDNGEHILHYPRTLFSTVFVDADPAQGTDERVLKDFR